MALWKTNNMNRHLTEEGNMSIKIEQDLSIINDQRNEITFQNQLAKVKHLLILSVEEHMDSQDLVFIACRSINGYSTLEKRSGLYLLKLNISIT